MRQSTDGQRSTTQYAVLSEIAGKFFNKNDQNSKEIFTIYLLHKNKTIKVCSSQYMSSILTHNALVISTADAHAMT